MPTGAQTSEAAFESGNKNSGINRVRSGPFNGQQISRFLTQEWSTILAAVSENSVSPQEKPMIYKPKATTSAWGSKDGVKSSPWGVKKGSKTANGLDLLVELKRPITTQAPSPQPTPPSTTKKTLTTTTKKNH